MYIQKCTRYTIKKSYTWDILNIIVIVIKWQRMVLKCSNDSINNFHPIRKKILKQATPRGKVVHVPSVRTQRPTNAAMVLDLFFKSFCHFKQSSR